MKIKGSALLVLLFILGMLPAAGALSLPAAPPPAVSEALPLEVEPPESQQIFVRVSRGVLPAVVNIATVRAVRRQTEDAPRSPFFDNPFFRRFFGDEFLGPAPEPQERQVQGLGSGVIVDPDGHIVTNYHVVSRSRQIQVVLTDGRRFEANLVGSDPRSDLAVVKIEASDLPTVPWGDSAQMEIGEYVLAVGSPFGLRETVTLGIISAVGRANVGIADYEDFIQTDAAINPGSSGGALVNVRGELIGINSAIFSQTGGSMGVGFAVPSNMARPIMQSLIETGRVVRGWLGVSVQEMTPDLAEKFGLPEPEGALVSEVQPNSPADRAGLRRGDVIVAINGEPVASTGDLRNRVASSQVGRPMRLQITRDGRTQERTATIEALPGEPEPPSAPEPPQAEQGTALSGLAVEELTPQVREGFNLPQDQEGVVVAGIEPGSRAETLGLLPGDVIVEVERKPVKNIKEFEAAIEGANQENSPLLFLVRREGSSLFLTLPPA